MPAQCKGIQHRSTIQYYYETRIEEALEGLHSKIYKNITAASKACGVLRGN